MSFIKTYNSERQELFDWLSSRIEELSKATIATHIRSLPMAVSSFAVTDIFTGEYDGNGALYNDGPFTFPVQFLHYFEEYDIGIPPEYEEYLIRVVGLR